MKEAAAYGDVVACCYGYWLVVDSLEWQIADHKWKQHNRYNRLDRWGSQIETNIPHSEEIVWLQLIGAFHFVDVAPVNIKENNNNNKMSTITIKYTVNNSNKCNISSHNFNSSIHSKWFTNNRCLSNKGCLLRNLKRRNYLEFLIFESVILSLISIFFNYLCNIIK